MPKDDNLNNDSSMLSITVVIPCYNVEKYLRECVGSLELDRHPEVDAVLVDDGSTDSTPAICDELAAAHTRLTVIHRENGGLPSARNAGLSRADGNWVWFVDSDDIIAPYALDVILAACRSSSADAIQFELLKFQDGAALNWPGYCVSDIRHLTASEFRRELHSQRRQHYACSFLFRNENQWNEKGEDSWPFCRGVLVVRRCRFYRAFPRLGSVSGCDGFSAVWIQTGFFVYVAQAQ